MNKRTKIGMVILTILPLLAGVIESAASLGHVVRDPWPTHALFHVIMGLGGLLATYGLIIVLTWGPLRRGERWAWYSIGVSAFGLLATMLVGDAMTDGGLRNQRGIMGSGDALWGGLWFMLFLYAVALALTFNHYIKGSNVTVIDPDLTDAFPNAKAVNEALREVLARRTRNET